MSVQRRQFVFLKEAVEIHNAHLFVDCIDHETVAAVLGVKDAFTGDLKGALALGESHLTSDGNGDDLVSAGMFAAVHDLIDVRAVDAAFLLHIGNRHALFRKDRFDVRAEILRILVPYLFQITVEFFGSVRRGQLVHQVTRFVCHSSFLSMYNRYMNSLSDYRELYHYDNKRSLVIDEKSGDVRMMKRLFHYDENVYTYLLTNKDKHIPKIYGCWKGGSNDLYVVEEFIQGNTFDVLINDRTMPDKTKLGFFLELLDGLAFLHNAPNPIIHRDLKPSNIMVTEKGELFILDYDAAKIYKPDSSGDTTYLGTDGVAAPEQYGFMQSDPRSDVYAVGKMLMAAFPDNAKIQKIAAKASSFDPNNRYANARELADVLAGRLSPNMKLKPLFPPPGFRTRKWWKIVIAIPSYLFLISLLIRFHADDDPMINTACQIIAVLMVIFSIDICNSWSGIFDVLPFVTHKNFFLRSLFKLIFIICTFFVLILISSIIVVIIKNITG